MLPRLYAILDTDVSTANGLRLLDVATGWRAAGVTLLQYRDKSGTDEQILRNAKTIAEIFAGSGATLILNDRADLLQRTEFDGVHVGQGDLSVVEAKAIVLRTMHTHRIRPERDEWGTRIRGIVGLSTHTEEQVIDAETSQADYVAIGPVFSTGTKPDAEPPVGLEGVRRARALTTKPLVAIGGITRHNARSIIDAGADSVAVISGLLIPGESIEKVARDFLDILR